MMRISDLDKLLSLDDLDESILKINDFICETCSNGEKMEILSEPQSTFYLNQNLEREVNNGGFNQYFINSGGDFAHETVDSLKAIGAHKTAKILQGAIGLFPDSRVPTNREERIKLVLQILPDSSDPVWEELDKSFFKYEEDLNRLNIDFVRKNRDEF